MPDLNMQLDAWTQEVMQLLSTAEAALAVQDSLFQQVMMQGAGSRHASSVDDGDDRAQHERQRQGRAVLQAMRGVRADAVANVQRLYDK